LDQVVSFMITSVHMFNPDLIEHQK